MAETNLGRIVPIATGNWNATTEYKMLDVVRNGNSVFWAKSNNIATPTTNADVWFLLGVFGENGFTPVFQVGIITTGTPGSLASVELIPDGTTVEGNPRYKMNMSIPQGAPGDGAGNLLVDETSLEAGKLYLFKPGADGSSVGELVEYVAPQQKQADWNQSTDTEPDYIKNKPSIPLKTSDLQNDSNYVTNTQLSGELNNKVDKINGKGLSANDFTDAYKGQIDDNATQIQALQGAVVYLGHIAETAESLSAEGGQALLNARATELLTGKPLKQGHTLIDTNNNDWWYNGEEAIWKNIGYSLVSTATNNTLGVVKGSTERGKVSIESDGTMKANTLPIHRTTVLSISNWTQGETYWEYTITDPNIIDGCYCPIVIENDSVNTANESGMLTKPLYQVGSMIIYVANQPYADINITYSIIL